MLKRIKFRIYPNKEQEQIIKQHLGCCRLIYNKFLSVREEAYKNGQILSYVKTSSQLTKLKCSPGFEYLNSINAVALQQSLRDLDKAYRLFFKGVTGHPRYKKINDTYQTYRLLNRKNIIRIKDNYIRLPKVGNIKMKQTLKVDNIRAVTVEKTRTGKYFVVLLMQFTPVILHKKTGKAIGIDVGLSHFYTDSNGKKVENPKFYSKAEKRIVREQRRLTRKQKGSINYNKQCLKLAKIYEKVGNQHNDFLQKATTAIIRENQTICIEDLDVKGMMQNHALSKAIASASWAKFFHMLKYKANWYGNVLIKIPRMYASSQICSCCGYVNTKVKDLSIRRWECPKCHAKHDRDINASINILNKGLTQI